MRLTIAMTKANHSGARLLRVVILAGLCCFPARAEDWTANGKTYHNVTVGQVEADRVHITYDGGVGTVALADLPADLQKRFNYDPANAKAAAQKRKDDQTGSQAGVPATNTPSEPPRDSAGQILQPDEVALEGFLGIPWGASSESAKKTMGEKGFTYVGLGKPNELVFKGGNFANFPAQQVTLTFFNDQFFQAEVDFTKTDDDAKRFSALTDAYVQKYGVQFEPHYPDASTCIWECKDHDTITLINSDGIGVVYINKSLSDQSHAAEVSKVKSTDL